MGIVLLPHANYALADIDDVIIFSYAWEDYMVHSDTVLRSIGNVGVTVKCKLSLLRVT